MFMLGVLKHVGLALVWVPVSALAWVALEVRTLDYAKPHCICGKIRWTYLLSQLIHCKNILVALTRVVTLVAWLILVSVANL